MRPSDFPGSDVIRAQTEETLTVAVRGRSKFPRRRGGMYRPEPELWRRLNDLFPGAPTEYDSVTEVLKSAPRRELTIWLQKEAARRPIEDPWTFDSVDKVLKDMSVTLDSAGDRGKTVHSWVEAFALGAEMDLSSVPDKYQGYAKAFLKWRKSVRGEVILTEANVYNMTHGYAGTADLGLAEKDNYATLYDFKTQKDARVYWQTGLQLAAYRHADVLVTKDGKVRPMPRFERIEAIGLGADGNWTPREFLEPKEWFQDFLAALRLHRRQKREA